MYQIYEILITLFTRVITVWVLLVWMEKMNKLEFLKIKNNDYSLQDHSLL